MSISEYFLVISSELVKETRQCAVSYMSYTDVL